MARGVELGGDRFFEDVEYSAILKYYGKEAADKLTDKSVDTGISEEEMETSVKDGWDVP